MTPEQSARTRIDARLAQAGWVVQDRWELKLKAGPGVAVREAATGVGPCDYRLFVDGRAAGVLEAKAPGEALMVAESQTMAYAANVPAHLKAPIQPLPFLYESNGAVIQYTNRLDPKPRSREIFEFPRPETLRAWLETAIAVKDQAPSAPPAATLLGRLQLMPELPTAGLWPAQEQAVRGLEASLKIGRRRALIQMATGAGKTFTAITALYRLIRHGGARRALFLVDRANLGRQALREFQSYRAPDDGRTFPELFNVSHLTNNGVDAASRVVITTIQRAYSVLKGEPALDPALEERSHFDGEPLVSEPPPVVYNPRLPPETFDIIVIDECHRSIYTLWRQVLEYFDASLIGLTATPGKDTYAFFRKNIVSEYRHERAVADRVNVPYEVYDIRTRITEQGGAVQAGDGAVVGRRDRQTRKVRWESLDQDLRYAAGDLDRDVVAEDQIRTVIQEFRERLFTDLFPGRSEIPKTLIFAKSDGHAEDVLRVVREELNLPNEGAVKITYKPESVTPDSSAPSRKAEDLIGAFRNSYYPRVAVTVDMIATGTDIKPLECLIFLRAVKSRSLFEQMKGRGVRVISDADFRAVTPDAPAKTHFVIVDAVGVCREEKQESRVVERRRLPDLKTTLGRVAEGGRDTALLEHLARQLDRLERQLSPAQRDEVAQIARGLPLRAIVSGLVSAMDPDVEDGRARRMFDLGDDVEPEPAQVRAAAEALREEATDPLTTNPPLRKHLSELRASAEQALSPELDELTLSAFSEDAGARAESVVRSFEAFLTEHKDEIEALSVLYARPYGARLTREAIRALAAAIQRPPRQWTPDALWAAYELVERDRVRGASAGRTWTDLVSLVRFALHQDDALRPFPEVVGARFDNWLAQQQNRGRTFTEEQVIWLRMIRDQISVDAEVRVRDLSDVPFQQHGGRARARQLFGDDLGPLIEELNRELVA